MAGLDFGNLNCYLALARNKGIDVLTNDYSLHATPSCVSFGPSARLIGYGARQQLNVNYENSVLNFKHLLGRDYSDPVVQAFLPYIPCKVVQLANDAIGLRVKHLGEERTYSAEQVVACLLTHLRQLLARSVGADVTECVVNVPYFFGQQQRMALLVSAKIAGLNVRLLNDHAALAYNFGMYRGSSLPKPEEPPKLVAFIDAGHSGVQASIVAFNAGKAKIMGAAHDLSVGGLHFDAVLRDYFNDHFRNQFKVDAKKNPRAWLRLLDECEKIKKQMSANSQTIPLNIECFMNDVDVSGRIQRDQFEQLDGSVNLFNKFQYLLDDLLRSAQIKVEDISEVELIGGSTRIPRIKKIISDFFKQDPKTTMNQDDAVARGCALRSAMSYAVYQMKHYLVEDPFELAIDCSKLPKEEELTDQLSAEQEMQAADLRDRQRSDAKNALEEYCFKVQHAMEDGQLCQGKLTEAERNECTAQCQNVLDWLEMESDTLHKKQIECRHSELENFCASALSKLYAVEKKEREDGNGQPGDRMDTTDGPEAPPNKQKEEQQSGKQKSPRKQQGSTADGQREEDNVETGKPATESRDG